MSTVLLLAVLLLLLGCLGLAVMAGLDWASARRRRQRVCTETLLTEIHLQRLTRQAMQRFLDEARNAQAGTKQ